MVGHDWHEFDADRGYEARRLSDEYQVRDRDGRVVTLTEAEFEQLRDEGTSPKGLQ